MSSLGYAVAAGAICVAFAAGLSNTPPETIPVADSGRVCFAQVLPVLDNQASGFSFLGLLGGVDVEFVPPALEPSAEQIWIQERIQQVATTGLCDVVVLKSGEV